MKLPYKKILFSVLSLSVCLWISCSSKSKSDSEDDGMESGIETTSDDFSFEDENDNFTSTSTDAYESGSEMSENSVESESSSSSLSQADVDAILKEYSDYISKVNNLIGKVKKGDVTAIKECSSFISEAQSLSSKLSSNLKDLDPKQLKKYQELQNKLQGYITTYDKYDDLVDKATEMIEEKAVKKAKAVVSKFGFGDDDDDDDDD